MQLNAIQYLYLHFYVCTDLFQLQRSESLFWAENDIEVNILVLVCCHFGTAVCSTLTTNKMTWWCQVDATQDLTNTLGQYYDWPATTGAPVGTQASTQPSKPDINVGTTLINFSWLNESGSCLSKFSSPLSRLSVWLDNELQGVPEKTPCVTW